MTTFGFRPDAAIPKYRRAGTSPAGTILAKKESRRSGPSGGKTCVPARANTACTCSVARRAVAVEATIFGLDPVPAALKPQSPSTAVSWSPIIVPSGPVTR